MHHTHHLELTLTGAPLVLDRVVSLCRSRRCAGVALPFEAAARHRPGRASVTVRAPARMARLAAERLARLPDVLGVQYVSDCGLAVRVERPAAAAAQCGSSPVAA